jgi:cyclopropane fatty-acyl-phospholipid synthase-like methyltransferase
MERTVVPMPIGSSSAFTDWDLHLFELWLGARTLPSAPIAGLKCMVLPVEYIRCAGTRYILHHLDVRAGQRVLDIGSPKLLLVFLAARLRAEVHATDLVDYFFQTYNVDARLAIGRERNRYHMASEDLRTLTCPSAHFERVFSISAIEHIPDGGDTRAIQEIAWVLAPGGIVCLTVLWSDHWDLEELKHRGDPDVYWERECFSNAPTTGHARTATRAA